MKLYALHAGKGTFDDRSTWVIGIYDSYELASQERERLLVEIGVNKKRYTEQEQHDYHLDLLELMKQELFSGSLAALDKGVTASLTSTLADFEEWLSQRWDEWRINEFEIEEIEINKTAKLYPDDKRTRDGETDPDTVSEGDPGWITKSDCSGN